MDVLVWFDGYCKINNDIENNKSQWKDIETDQFGNKFETAEIKKIAGNGWGTVFIYNGTKSVSIHKGDMVNLSLNIDDQIQFTVKENPIAQNITKQ